ncbi:hypothetical protein [Cupriavidus sp. AcVe19-6a]|uniref:hypothetical protein n=1 Tax=Cupriavidus sp. AcVe19-6a TaxID=2821358 RepID=UPI001AEA2308|nr:hypothetical protein [Cupriavidus sp. AcVe19-6a]MBP0634877.1 hypothetical protein [Cupriavidus sp. AcVe19-6a]
MDNDSYRPLDRPSDIIALGSTYPLPHEIQAMTAQNVFDACATHMMRQGAPAVSVDDLSCRYRAGGMACGVGAVVPEAWYTERIESMTVSEILAHDDHAIIVPEFRAFLQRHQPLLADIQSCHDTVHVPDWRRALTSIAAKYGLAWRCLARFDTKPAVAYSPSEQTRRLAAQISQ